MICVLRGVGRMAAMETRAGHVDFFISLYAFWFMRIDKHISEWNCIEKSIL